VWGGVDRKHPIPGREGTRLGGARGRGARAALAIESDRPYALPPSPPARVPFAAAAARSCFASVQRQCQPHPNSHSPYPSPSDLSHQIRRSSYHNVVRVLDVGRMMDVSGIQVRGDPPPAPWRADLPSSLVGVPPFPDLGKPPCIVRGQKELDTQPFSEVGVTKCS